jgi:hypothetical protein
MELQSFEHYRDNYVSKLSDIPIHNNFRKVMDWVKDKPGHVTSVSELASVISGKDKPDNDAMRAAIGVAGILTTWPDPLGDIFFEVMAEDGSRYPVQRVPQEAVDGVAPYVLEATGETIEDFPSRALVRIRIVDFEPSFTFDNLLPIR